MDLKRLTRDADELIRKVVARYNQLYSPVGTISQVELDLMLDDMRKLYDTFKHIGQVNLTLSANIETRKPAVSVSETVNTAPEEPEKIPSDPAIREQPSQKPEPQPQQESIPEAKPEPELIQSPEPEPEHPSETPASSVMADPPEKQENSATNKYEMLPENTANNPSAQHSAARTENTPYTLADKFKDSGKSLSETMAASSTQNGLGSRMVFQPISDLTSAIGLNDKFNFINNLFNNNGGLYSEAINRMNKAVNYDEAMWILQNYKIPSWSENAETLHRLTDFIKRRFI